MLDKPIKPGKLIEEIVLFCKAYPLSRARCERDSVNVYQPLHNQGEMRSMLSYYRPDKPIKAGWIDVTVFYERPLFKPLKYVSKYDVDNVLKAVCDNLVYCKVIEDDRNLLGAAISKQYSVEDYMIIKLYEAGFNGDT